MISGAVLTTRSNTSAPSRIACRLSSAIAITDVQRACDNAIDRFAV